MVKVMARQNPGDQEQQQTNWSGWLPVVGIVAIMATGCLSTFMFLQLDMLRPGVGDMVVFTPAQEDTDTWDLTVAATDVAGPSTPAETCELTPSVMAHNGGSLVVEARQEGRPAMYRLHWSGARTSAGSLDCGPQADLTVSRLDLQKLANSAGGFGVGSKGVLLR